MSFTYLCSPYSHPDPAIREARFVAACRAAAWLMRQGVPVFSPIAHSHPIERHFDAIEGLDFWMQQDLPILAAASKVVVLMLDGWKESRGIARETSEAAKWGIPVEYIKP